MYRLFVAVAIVVALAAIAGCGAHSRYVIQTDGNGSLEGLRVTPADGSFNVPVEIWVRVYWPPGYEPPPEFRFILRDEYDDRVLTYKHDGELRYEWFFEPYVDLNPGSRYKVEITAGDEKYVSYFYTEEYEMRSPSTNEPQNAGPRSSGPQAEHLVTTTR